VLCDRVGDEAV